MMFEPGDKYIHFTNRGGVNRGIVSRIDTIHVTNTDHCCVFYQHFLVNEKNVIYALDGKDGRFYKIEKEYTKEEAEQLANAFKHLKDLKEKRRQEIISEGPKRKAINTKLEDCNFDDVIKQKFDTGE